MADAGEARGSAPYGVGGPHGAGGCGRRQEAQLYVGAACGIWRVVPAHSRTSESNTGVAPTPTGHIRRGAPGAHPYDPAPGPGGRVTIELGSSFMPP